MTTMSNFMVTQPEAVRVSLRRAQVWAVILGSALLVVAVAAVALLIVVSTSDAATAPRLCVDTESTLTSG